LLAVSNQLMAPPHPAGFRFTSEWREDGIYVPTSRLSRILMHSQNDVGMYFTPPPDASLRSSMTKRKMAMDGRAPKRFLAELILYLIRDSRM